MAALEQQTKFLVVVVVAPLLLVGPQHQMEETVGMALLHPLAVLL
jgi:hypothetical protein